MAGKPGTMLGRALLHLLPENSPLHAVAEAVDKTIETVVFDHGQDVKVPLKEHSDIKNLLAGVKPLLLGLAEKGLISINFPLVEGDDETKVEHGLLEVLEGYVNATL